MAGQGVRAVYQPFSLQERMAPLNMMKEEYDKVNEGLADLEMTTNQVAQYIDPNSQAGQVLAQYNKLLEDTAGILSREGLKGVSRTTLQNLKRTYNSQIAPINEGAKNYAALQAQIKQMQWKDPTIMVTDMPSLDDYIKNPNRLPNLVSGAQLMQEGATAALQLPGVDYDAISRFLAGDKTAIPNIDQSVERIAQSYGVSNQQALDYISRGVLSGLGQRATKLADAKAAAEMEFDYKMRLEKYQQGQQNYRAGLDAAARKRDDDLAALMRGYVWNPNTKQYEFSQEALNNAAKSASSTGTRSSRSANSSTSAAAQKHQKTKGVSIYDKEGSLVGNAKDDTAAQSMKVRNDKDKVYGGDVKRHPKSFSELSDESKVSALRHARLKGLIDAEMADDNSPYKSSNGTYNWDEIYADYGGILDLYVYTELEDKKGNKYVMIGETGSSETAGSNPSSSSTASIDEKYGTGGDDGSNYVPNE